LELQRRLTESGSRIPIIFITARANEEEERRAIEAGAVSFLRKPFGEEALMGAVRKAIGQSLERKQDRRTPMNRSRTSANRSTKEGDP